MLAGDVSVVVELAEPWKVVRASEGVIGRLGREPAALIGAPLADLIRNDAAVSAILVSLKEGDPSPARDTVEVGWRSSDVAESAEMWHVRACPLYADLDGALHQALITFRLPRSGSNASTVSSSDGSDVEAERLTRRVCAESFVVEGVRNVAWPVKQLLDHASKTNGSAHRVATAALCASAMQKSMFSNVLLTRPRSGRSPPLGPEEGGGRNASSGYEIWHASTGISELLGYPREAFVGVGADVLAFAPKVSQGETPPPALLDQVGELHAAIEERRNALIETVLTSSRGAPVFCLAYVLPLECPTPCRAGAVAVAVLDVHRSLAYMQRQVEARGIADCDMYTFMRLSLLNLLVTDPSVASADPLARNPIVFASAGCADLAAISPR